MFSELRELDARKMIRMAVSAQDIFYHEVLFMGSGPYYFDRARLPWSSWREFQDRSLAAVQ